MSIDGTTVTLKLEAIGDDVVQAYRAWRRQGGPLSGRLQSGLERLGAYNRKTRQHNKPPVPWVAEVRIAPNGDLERNFLRGQKDYAEADHIGWRGVYVYFHLCSGRTYEVNDVARPKRSRRYFCRVVDGRVKEIAFEELAA